MSVKRPNGKWLAGLILLIVAGWLAGQVYQGTIFAKAVALSVIPARPAPTVDGLNIVVPNFDDAYWDLVRRHVAAHCEITESRADAVLSLAICLRTLVDRRRTNQSSVLALDYLQFFHEDPQSPTGEPVSCALYVSLLNTALAAHGCHARRIDLLNTTSLNSQYRRFLVNFKSSEDTRVFDRHQALEYFDVDTGEWVYVDGWYGLVFQSETGAYLSAWDLQSADAAPKLIRVHSFHRPYGWEEYGRYFGQVAFGKNLDPSRKFNTLRDEYGTAFRAFDIRQREDSRTSDRLIWTFRGRHDERIEAAIKEYLARESSSCFR